MTMRNLCLVGGLFLGSFLFLSSCDLVDKKKPGRDSSPRKQDPGPAVKPDPKETPPDTVTPTDPSRGLSRYRSCDELQEAVFQALSYKKKNDAAYLAAKRELEASRRRSVRRPTGATSERTTSVAARPQAAPPSARATKSAAVAKQPSTKAKKLEQFTNIQEIGVDEPDHVKIGPDNIYLLRGLEIQVASRKTLKHLGRVQLKQLTVAKKLLITARHLFVLGELEEKICTDRGLRRRGDNRIHTPPKRRKAGMLKKLWQLLVPEAHAVPGSMIHRRPRPEPVLRARCTMRPDTVVQAYRLRADGPPAYVRSWRFKGRYVDARMTAGRIVLIFQQQLNLVPQVRTVLSNPAAFLANVTIPKKPILLDTRKKTTLLSCSAIFRSKMDDQDYRLTKVVAIDASVLANIPKQAGFVGGGDQIYMSTQNLYISKVGKRWAPWSTDPTANASRARKRSMRDSLVITQVGFAPRSGEITILAQTDSTIRGRPKDQWAFKELTHRDGTPLLGVFTTTGKMWSKDPQDLTNNYLWILKRSGSELSVVAKIADIARGESIRSLRYIGKWAYAVTFKKTDPLFAIDLTDPLQPHIVGELKIPGFSTYMHPVGEGKLIGIGFDVHEDIKAGGGAESVKFQGIKLSLFDISNPRDMRELDTMTFGGRGSYSDVTGDHHAFFYDPKLKRLAFPLTLLQGESKTEKWQTQKQITFAGAVLVQIGGQKLKELAKWRHNRWIPVKCYQEMQKGRWWESRTESQDVNRIFRIGDKYLTASRYGLKTYSVRTPQVTRQKLHFPGDFADCGIGRAKN
jgi:uncharacterized secreted protein with C-terminal beta-propeller domain